ncbi:amino acid ABC transporter substrate-binding protein [Halomonas sp. C22]|uniref:amino acid ABC transporter substrate-binding protein n=1 Tax=Halomonas sp. C22 TaxID=2580567 RepID=UPI0021B3C627|nr:amino acid ABC transporter substrate-binding protein [Halomonas sp. C22]
MMCSVIGRYIALMGLLLLAMGMASAQTGSTLARIQQDHTILIGHREHEEPFSYVVEGRPIGYSIDICQAVVDSISARLGGPALAVTFVPVTPANRFILLSKGDIDLECGVTTNTAERRRQAAFSYPHYFSTTRYVSLTKNALDRIEDLTGRSVVSTTGTLNIEQLNAMNREQGLNISVMLSRSHDEAFTMVAAEQASAFVMDDILLAGLVASDASPERFHISSEALSDPEPYGLMLRRDDPEFLAWVNEALRALYQSGDMLALYEKWFLSPIPPDQQVVGLPMSPQLEAVLTHPEAFAE